MKISSTLILKLVVAVASILVLILGSMTTYLAITEEEASYYRPILLLMSVSTLPFFFAAFQTLRLLNLIDKNQAFSEHSVKALRYIKYSAGAFGIWYTIGMPYIYAAAELDDAPGVILIGMMLVGASAVVAIFAALLQRILKDALNLKSENDLTV